MGRQLDGVDDYAHIPAASAAFARSPSSALTIAFAFKITNPTANRRLIYINGSNGTQYQVIVATSLGLQFSTDFGSEVYSSSTDTQWNDNQWHYFVARWSNGNPQRESIWSVDGVQVEGHGTTTNRSGTLQSSSDSEFWIGRQSFGNFTAFTISRLFIHNGELSDAQVATLISGTLPVTPGVDYWAMDEPGSTEAGVNGNVLTWYGAALVSDDGLPSTGPVQVALSGSLTPSGGTPVRRPQVSRSGAVTATGALLSTRVVPRTFTATVTMAGAIVRSALKGFGGSATPAAASVKAPAKSLAGSASILGEFEKVGLRTVTSSIAVAGVAALERLGRAFGQPGIVAVTIRAAGDLRVRIRRAF